MSDLDDQARDARAEASSVAALLASGSPLPWLLRGDRWHALLTAKAELLEQAAATQRLLEGRS
jgi:hypothetical protein